MHMKILPRSWKMGWQNRALRILGMVLALTAANTIYRDPHRINKMYPWITR